MDYKEIRNTIVKGLHEFLNVPVVPTDDIGDKPDYPYISYKFTTLKMPQGSHNLYRDVVKSNDDKFQYDVEYTRKEQPKMVLSMNSYSEDEVEAYQLALEMEAWFKFYGYMYLKENGIIIVDIGNVQDRTIRIVDNYEKRQGFDVSIRVMDIRKLRTETIEKYNIKKE